MFIRNMRSMKKQNCHILLHDFLGRNLFVENPWCTSCDETNVAIFGSEHFEVFGDTFIHGYCRKCGTKVLSRIIEKRIN